MEITRFACNMLQENCYVVSDDTKECVIIDCGAFYQEERKAIVDYIKGNGLKPVHLLATHGHIDHNFGNNTIYEEFGLKPEVDANDEKLMGKLDEQAIAIAGVVLGYDMPPIGHYFRDKEDITFGNHTLTVMETPGHSPGSVFFYCKEEDVAFTGDTLFKGSIGRSDFEGGSRFMLIQSLRTVCQMPDKTRIFPGHGPESTIGYELAHNPYLDR